MGCITSKNQPAEEKGANAPSVVFQHTGELLGEADQPDAARHGTQCVGGNLDPTTPTTVPSSQGVTFSEVGIPRPGLDPYGDVEFPTKRVRPDGEEGHPVIQVRPNTSHESATSPDSEVDDISVVPTLRTPPPTKQDEVMMDIPNQGQRRQSAVFQTALRNAHELEHGDKTSGAEVSLTTAPRAIESVSDGEPIPATTLLIKSSPPLMRTKNAPTAVPPPSDTEQTPSGVTSSDEPRVGARISAALAKEFRGRLGIPSPEKRNSGGPSEADSGVDAGAVGAGGIDSHSDSGPSGEEANDSEPEYDYAHRVGVTRAGAEDDATDPADGDVYRMEEDSGIGADTLDTRRARVPSSAAVGCVVENKAVATMGKDEIDRLVDSWENEGLQELIDSTVHKPSFRNKDAQRLGTMDATALEKMVDEWEEQGKQEASALLA
eukprot:m.165912 g.165912  ORF g.165912 m.165912 type:complete len:434 (+) comp24024_c1_seq1:7620-8921(+)